jgi:hypothetical protein
MLPKPVMETGQEGFGLADTCLDQKQLSLLGSNRELPMILIDQSTRFRRLGS